MMTERNTKQGTKCPLCGRMRPYNQDFCFICHWEEDWQQQEDHDKWGCANIVSFNEAKMWYTKLGTGWWDEWVRQLNEHYRDADTYPYAAWRKDKTGWKPEP